MHIKGHRIETNFALYFTPFDVTFAKGSPLLMSFFSGRSKKIGLLARNEGSRSRSGDEHGEAV